MHSYVDLDACVPRSRLAIPDAPAVEYDIEADGLEIDDNSACPAVMSCIVRVVGDLPPLLIFKFDSDDAASWDIDSLARPVSVWYRQVDGELRQADYVHAHVGMYSGNHFTGYQEFGSAAPASAPVVYNDCMLRPTSVLVERHGATGRLASPASADGYRPLYAWFVRV